MDPIRQGEACRRYILHLIKTKKNREVCEYLRYVDPRMPIDKVKGTLLHYAAMFGNRILAKHFIELGFDVNAQTKGGKTPLMLAIINQYARTIDTLLKENADIHIRDANGRNAIDLISDDSGPVWPEIVRLILTRLKEDTRRSEDLANLLCNANCPLDRLMYLQNAEVTRIILNRGRAVNYKDPYTGLTALHIAVDNVDLPNVRILLGAGADVNSVDKYNQTAVLHSSKFHRSSKGLKILKLILMRDISLTTHALHGVMQLFSLLKEGNKTAVKMVLDKGVDFEARDAAGATALHYLAMNTQPDIIDLLEGMTLNVNAHDYFGGTVLHTAAKFGNVSTLMYLLARGANVNAVDRAHGVSPLFYALVGCTDKDSKRIEDTVTILMQHGADSQLVNYTGRTVFDEVLHCRNLKFMEPVLAHLALLEVQGTVIANLVRQKINLHLRMRNYFNICQAQLRQMKMVSLYGSVMLIDILIESEQKLEVYAGNWIIVSTLARFNEKYSANSYYFDYIRKRFGKAMETARLREKAAKVIARIMGLENDFKHIAVEKIVRKLNYHDLLKFA